MDLQSSLMAVEMYVRKCCESGIIYRQAFTLNETENCIFDNYFVVSASEMRFEKR